MFILRLFICLITSHTAIQSQELQTGNFRLCNEFLSKTCFSGTYSSVHLINAVNSPLNINVLYAEQLTLPPLQTIRIERTEPLPLVSVAEAGDDGYHTVTHPLPSCLYLTNTCSESITHTLYYESQHISIDKGEYRHLPNIENAVPRCIRIDNSTTPVSGSAILSFEEANKETLIITFQPYKQNSLHILDKQLTFSSTEDISSPLVNLFHEVLQESQIDVEDYVKKIQIPFYSTIDTIKETYYSHSENKTYIPKIIHTIWLNGKSNKFPSPQFGRWLSDTMNTCKPEEGWRYFLWVNRPNEYSEKFKEQYLSGILEKHKSSITIICVEDYFNNRQLHVRAFYDAALALENYGSASDVLRYEIMMNLGGVYRDVDYRFVHSPEELHSTVGFYGSVEVFDPSVVANAMFAARPMHPIMKACVKQIEAYARQHNYHQWHFCPYNALQTHHEHYKTLFTTGPHMLSLQCYHYSKGMTDAAALPFPAPTDPSDRIIIFPSAVFLSPIITQNSFGQHYNNFSWQQTETNSIK